MATNVLVTNVEAIATPDIILNQSQRGGVVARTAAACLALSICVGANNAKAEGSTAPVASGNHTIVLAQANTQETDEKIYTAEVIQIDGTKKVVKYFRDME